LKRSQAYFILLAAAAVAALAGIYAGIAGRETPVNRIPAEAVARLLSTRMNDSGGKTHDFAQWRGQTLVINFWATWCEPCRDEMPALSRLHQRFSPKGINFVGIALDTPANVADFAKKLAISYPLVIAGSEGIELSQELGNSRSALPYTVVLGADGETLLTRLGRVSEAELTRLLQDRTRP
jgi:thiol-disulfide isomerase/thioredoxin